MVSDVTAPGVGKSSGVSVWGKVERVVGGGTPGDPVPNLTREGTTFMYKFRSGDHGHLH